MVQLATPLVVAITGATGIAYGIRVLELLRQNPDVQSHLVMSRSARATLRHECDLSAGEVRALADVVHSNDDLGASISSGSFVTLGMIVAPCSVKTLSGVANCYDDSLVVRAADVTLKERRRLVLLLRETPLHAGHLRLMSDVTTAGGVIMPPVPALYLRPRSVEEIVDHTAARALDLFGLAPHSLPRWDARRRLAGADYTGEADAIA